MIRSSIYSYLILRLGLVVLLAWHSIKIFVAPQLRLATGIFSPVSNWQALGFSAEQILYLIGILLAVTVLSLFTGVFIKSFSLISSILFLLLLISGGISDFSISYALVICCFLALVVEPEKRPGLIG